MPSVIVSRLFQALVVLVFVSILVFVMMRVVPGDPASIALGENATPEAVAAMREELGLDQPLWVQYLTWIGGVFTGDLGRSIASQQPVDQLIAQKLPITMQLGVTAFVLAVLVGVPAGVIAAVRRGTWLDSLLTVLANVGMAVPIFWLGILGIYVFSVNLGWLPVQGYTPPTVNLWENIRQITMPVILLSLVPLSQLARQTRSSMLEVVGLDFMRTARAKGLPRWRVTILHGLRNSLIPIVTLFGVGIASAAGGSVFVEQIFNIPGLGLLLVDSIFAKDYVVVQSVVLLLAAIVVAVTFLVDITYTWIDPRIRT